MYNPDYYQEHKDEIRIKNKRWRDNRVRKGLCIICNNQLSAKSKCFCEYHRLMNTANHQKHSIKSGKKAYQFYITADEAVKLKEYLKQLRKPAN
jgi:hypothetical protein